MLRRINYVVYFLLFLNLIPYFELSSEVTPLFDEFKVKMEERCDSKYISPAWRISVKIVDTIPLQDENVIGVCLNKAVGFDILLLKSYWDRSSEVRRKQLVWHELLHCYLDVGHVPNTIMAEYDINWPEEEVEAQLIYFIDKACRNE